MAKDSGGGFPRRKPWVEIAAALLLFFGDVRCGALFMVIHVIYKYKNR